MSRIEKISEYIALKIKNENNLNEEKYEVIKYGLHAVFQMAFSILTVIIIGAIFNVAFEAFIISLIISILRRSAGGAHASTELNCALIGALVSVFLAVLIMKINMGIELAIVILIIAMMISYILLRKLAPVDSPNKPIRTEKKIKRLKKASLITWVIYMILVIIFMELSIIFKIDYFEKVGFLITFGCLWQSYTLTRSCHNLYEIMDGFLINLFKGRKKNE